MATTKRANFGRLLVLTAALVAAKYETPNPYVEVETEPEAQLTLAGARLSLAPVPASLVVDEDGPFPLPLTARRPLGSLIYEGEVSGMLATIADSDDFETGSLGPQWSTSSSAPSGRLQVTGGFGTAGTASRC